MSRWQSGISNFRLPVASALPDAACELSAPLPWKRVLRLAVFGSFKPMMMIFRHFSKKAPHLPHETLAMKNLVPIRRETRRALENRAIMRICVWRYLRFSA